MASQTSKHDDAPLNGEEAERSSGSDKESLAKARSNIAIGSNASIPIMPKVESASRDSSPIDERSKYDSISATSGRNNWSGVVSDKELIEDNKFLDSIKGDSVSATIADYNRKQANRRYKSASSSRDEQQSTASTVGGGFERTKVDDSRFAMGETSSTRIDHLSVNMNYYAAGSSMSGPIYTPGNHYLEQGGGSRDDLVNYTDKLNKRTSTSDAFDMIDERDGNHSTSSVSEDVHCHQLEGRQTSHSHTDPTSTNRKQCLLKCNRKYQSKLKKSQDPIRHNRHHQGHRVSSSHTDQVTPAPTFIYDLPSESYHEIEPIIIRGNGNLTLFGLSNSFNSEFPPALVGRVSKEEFDSTMTRINTMLRDQQSLSARLLLIGGLFCCCTFGFSLVWPSIALKERSRMNLQKFLATENSRLYSDLGLNWRLDEQRCYSHHAFVECVLVIEFTPKLNLYQPD